MFVFKVIQKLVNTSIFLLHRSINSGCDKVEANEARIEKLTDENVIISKNVAAATIFKNKLEGLTKP